MDYTLGNRTLTFPSVDDLRIAMLLWGENGCGKTTLAATAPGTKLWIQFDHDGVLSLVGREDVVVLDLSAEKHYIVEKFRDDNPFGLEKMLLDHPEIETVVVDSMTSYAYLALQNAVSKSSNSSIEVPGMHGYGYRNSVALRFATVLMSLTTRLKRHIIFITHEGTPNKTSDGAISSVSLALSEGVAAQLGLRLNEVWHLEDTGTQRRIAVRPCRMRKPMKTRMWDASASSEFVWNYDANTWSGDGIETWFKQWKDNGGRKLAIPTAGSAAVRPVTKLAVRK